MVDMEIFPNSNENRETFIHPQTYVESEFIMASYRNSPFFSPIHHLRRRKRVDHSLSSVGSK